MAQESAYAFMVKARADQELQQKLRQLNPTDFDSLMAIVTKNGYKAFTKDEYYSAAEQAGGEWRVWAARMRGEAANQDLSDTELEQVAGGKGGALTVCYDTSFMLRSNC
jgi:predicted ribosomally synthesized peptide with nif11-like leader